MLGRHRSEPVLFQYVDVEPLVPKNLCVATLGKPFDVTDLVRIANAVRKGGSLNP